MASLTVHMGTTGAVASPAVGLASGTGTAQTPGAALSMPVGQATGTGAAYTPAQGGVDPVWAVTDKAYFAALRASSSWVDVAPPGTIPHDGVTSSSAAINTFISGLPNWRRVTWPSGWDLVLTGDSGFDFSSKSKQHHILTGVTIRNKCVGTSNFSNTFFIQGTSDLIIDNGTVIGEMTNVGNAASLADINENIGGLRFRAGSSYVELNGTVFQAIRGWPVDMAGREGSGAIGAHLWVHNITTTGGETPLVVTAGYYGIFEHNGPMVDATHYGFDFEPDPGGCAINHMLVQYNDFRRWGQRSNPIGGGTPHQNWWMGLAQGYSGPPWYEYDDIIIRYNSCPEGEVTGQGGICVTGNNTIPKTDIQIYGNTGAARTSPTSTTAGAATTSDGAWGMYFNFVNNLQVHDNVMTTPGHVAMVGLDTNASGTHVITPNTT